MSRSGGPPSDPSPGTDPSTFLFADLAGFTALTEAHGDAEATEIAENFAARPRCSCRATTPRRSRRSGTR
jgi:class 3 adenylate cyclase